MLKPRVLASSFVLFASVAFCPVSSFADLPGLDKSPADIAYFRKSRDEAPVAKLIYSRPQKNGRAIFGGKPVKAGRYSLFTIPNEKSWTIVLNSVLDVWGAAKYDQSKDVLRVDVPVGKTKSTVEAFTMQFAGEPPSGKLLFVWDDVWVEVPVSF